MSAEIGFALNEKVPLSRLGKALDKIEQDLIAKGNVDAIRRNGHGVFGIAFKTDSEKWTLAYGDLRIGETYSEVIRTMGLHDVVSNLAIAEITRKLDGLDFAPCVRFNYVAGSVVGRMGVFRESKIAETEFVRERQKYWSDQLKIKDKQTICFLYAISENYSKLDLGQKFSSVLNALKLEKSSLHLMFITPEAVHLVRSDEIPERKGKPSNLFFSQSSEGLVFGSNKEALQVIKDNGQIYPIEEGQYKKILLSNGVDAS